MGEGLRMRQDAANAKKTEERNGALFCLFLLCGKGDFLLTEVDDLHLGMLFLVEAEGGVGELLAFLEIADIDGGLAAALGGHHDAGGQIGLLVER